MNNGVYVYGAGGHSQLAAVTHGYAPAGANAVGGVCGRADRCDGVADTPLFEPATYIVLGAAPKDGFSSDLVERPVVSGVSDEVLFGIIEDKRRSQID